MALIKFRDSLLICLAIQIGSVFFSCNLFAQRLEPISTSEIGIGIGGANYKGEISPNYRFLNNQPALTVFYRHNMSDAITLRGGLMGSHRIFENNTFSDSVYEADRPFHAFREGETYLSLFEVSAVVEYNFLDFYDMRQKPRLSPYVFIGVAGLAYNVKLELHKRLLPGANGDRIKPFETNLAVAVPFGVGVKYALSRHWNLGAEFGARKMITDKLDNLSGEDPVYLANPHDNDWYFYNGISVSYTFYRINCPPVYKKTPGLLD